MVLQSTVKLIESPLQPKHYPALTH